MFAISQSAITGAINHRNMLISMTTTYPSNNNIQQKAYLCFNKRLNKKGKIGGALNLPLGFSNGIFFKQCMGEKTWAWLLKPSQHVVGKPVKSTFPFYHSKRDLVFGRPIHRLNITPQPVFDICELVS